VATNLETRIILFSLSVFFKRRGKRKSLQARYGDILHAHFTYAFVDVGVLR
jgi:hypothetical protein